MKAAPIEARKMITPDTHTIGVFRYELKYNPRAIWVYISTKNNEAPFACKYRIIHPASISRIMWITESKAIDTSAT